MTKKSLPVWPNKYGIRQSVKSTNPFKSVIQTFTKAHGEDFTLETMEGEGTDFIIHLPVV